MAGKRGKSGKNEARLLTEAQAMATMVNEARRGGGKKKGKRGTGDPTLSVRPHKSITKKCKHCGKWHDASQHASHGLGSFERTHGNAELRLARELSKADAEDLLALL